MPTASSYPASPASGGWRCAQPIGPVAAFAPWNFPISSPARKLGGALGAGCSIILKASEETPAVAHALVECLHEAGVPAGAVNLVFGDPSEISTHLIASPIIRAITFTGPISVGKHLGQLCAAAMKPAIMELGGHSPVIVCDDTEAAEVGRLGAAAKFRNAGQICTAPTRFIVQERVHDRFVESFVEAANALKVGNGLESGVQMGPLANDRRLSALQGMIADAVEKGAKVAAGGSRIGNRGYFLEPTVLTDVPEDATVMNVEPFGALAPIVRYRELEEAITIANRLPYGLCSFAFTTSQTRAVRARQPGRERHHVDQPFRHERPGYAVRRRQGERLRPRGRIRDAGRLHADQVRFAQGFGLIAALVSHTAFGSQRLRDWRMR